MGIGSQQFSVNWVLQCKGPEYGTVGGCLSDPAVVRGT